MSFFTYRMLPLALCYGALLPSASATERSALAYELVARAAFEQLDREGMRGLGDADAVVAATVQPLTIDPADANRRDAHLNHRFCVSWLADGEGDWPERRYQAKNAMNRAGVERLGFAPWALKEAVDDLAKAWGEGDGDAARTAAGAVVHFATDLCLSPHVPRHRAVGDLAERAGASDLFEAGDGWRTARHAWLRKHRERVSARLSRVTYQAEIDGSVDALLARASRRTYARSRAEQAFRSALRSTDQLVDGQGGEAEARYYRRDGGWLIIARLGEAVGLAGSLIESACAAVDCRGGGEERESGDDGSDVAAQESAPYVGSRHSRVFHKADCPHADRI